MARRHMNYVALDVHSAFCEGGYLDHAGRERGAWRTATAVPPLVEAIDKVPRPRSLVIEEGPLADWLARNLREHVDELVVADPHRNALIAKEGDKSDAIDWRKLADLHRGGYVRAVHHPEELARSLFKQHVQLYHDRVRHRVSEALKVVWRARRLGVFVKERDLADAGRRAAMLGQLPPGEDGATARLDLRVMLDGYDSAAGQVRELKGRLVALSKDDPIVRNLCDLPGVGPVRAGSRAPPSPRDAGRVRRHAVPIQDETEAVEVHGHRPGAAAERQRPRRPARAPAVQPDAEERDPENVIPGAAKSAAASGNNPFADPYERWIEDGCSPRIARRNTARSLATTAWGMWKSGSVYDPTMIGRQPERTTVG